LVLDSFLGSGTTAAVAHKMGRRWIGIEMGEHAATHCLPRLQKVIEGEQGGISEAVDWRGGGGFRFMKLGEPVFQDDGRINPQIRFATLASYLWFLETGAPHASGTFDSPLLGITGEGENAVAYVLLYNGILGDKRPAGGNVLTSVLWPHIENLAPGHRGRWVIYGEAARIPESRRRSLNLSFKQIPYDIRMK
jgi:adenine-specific DNA-methyltransferase